MCIIWAMPPQPMTPKRNSFIIFFAPWAAQNRDTLYYRGEWWMGFREYYERKTGFGDGDARENKVATWQHFIAMLCSNYGGQKAPSFACMWRL
jgi:hypothetical protein